MMKKRAFVLFLGLLLLCSAAASAYVLIPSTFSVEIEPVNDIIVDSANDYADIQIIIENKGDVEDTFKLLYLEDPVWSYQVIPSPINKQVTIAAGETDKIHILLKGDVTKNIYSVKVRVQSLLTKNIEEGIMLIRVGESSPAEVPNPDFDVDVSVPTQMDPKGSYNIIVNIHNNNERVLENVAIKLHSNIINEITDVRIEPNESKSLSFAIILIDNIKPQTDQLHVTVSYEEEEFHYSDYNFEVVEFVPPFSTDITIFKRFLKQERTITITNKGNTLKSDAVMIETSLKERLFSSSNPKFRGVKQDGRQFVAWDVSLESGESTEIKLTTSYRILLLLALLMIVFIAYKLALSNPLIVKKKIRSIHKTHGGAMSDMSITIYLKNRGKETLSNIRIVERVTKMVHIKKDSFSGSMHPVKMHEHGREGTLLEYRFGELAPGDERIINYKVHAKLHMFGTITIKPTVAEFNTKTGAKKKSKSREVSVTTDEPLHQEKHKHKAQNK